MTLFVCLLAMATLNVALGYGLAVYLGQSAPAVYGELPIARPATTIGPESNRSGAPVRVPEKKESLAPTEPVDSPSEATDTAKPAVPVAEPSLSRHRVSDEEKRVAAEEVAAALDTNRGKAPAIEPNTGAEQREKSPFEESLGTFKDSLAGYSERLSRLDQQMREHASEEDKQGVRQAVADICQANDSYLREQGRAAEEIACGRRGKEDMGQGLSESLQRQELQVSEANQALRMIDFDTNFKAALQRALCETAKIGDANCRVRDAVSQTMLDLAEHEGRGNALDEETKLDPQTGLLSQAGFLAALRESLEDPERNGAPLSLAMLDLDGFQGFNQEHGRNAGDEVLRVLGQLIHPHQPSKHVAGRYQGGTFAVFWPGLAARNITAEVERIRQSLESTRFLIGDRSAQVTVSCSVVQSVATDTRESLLQRGLQTMSEARRYGRNRTFLNETNHPAPVLPPNLTIQEREVVLGRSAAGDEESAS